MNRNKTHRRSITDVSGQVFGRNDSLEAYLEKESMNAFKRPWHKLEAGLRLNRLRLFVDDMAKQRGLKEEEKASLMKLLSRAMERKILTSKTAVSYDVETERITEIKPLVMHPSATGEILFQIVEKRGAVTFRKRPTRDEAGGANT